MKNLLLRRLMRPRGAAAPLPAERCADATVQAVMAETQRELAVFASEMMGAQTFVGQFDRGRSERARGEPIDSVRIRSLVEDTAGPVMLIDPRPGLRIVDVNDAYAGATLTLRDRAAGEKLFDVFPDNPGDPEADGVSNLYESIQRAAQSGRPHIMAVQRYDVRDGHGRFVERCWQPINTPVFDARGRLIYIFHEANPLSPRKR